MGEGGNTVVECAATIYNRRHAWLQQAQCEWGGRLSMLRARQPPPGREDLAVAIVMLGGHRVSAYH